MKSAKGTFIATEKGSGQFNITIGRGKWFIGIADSVKGFISLGGHEVVKPAQLRELADFIEQLKSGVAPAPKQTKEEILGKLKALLPQRLFWELEMTAAPLRSIIVCGTVKDIILEYRASVEEEKMVAGLLADLLQVHFSETK